MSGSTSSVSQEVICRDCSERFPDSRPVCPHCGRPSLFPNVTAASRQEERHTLLERYHDAWSGLISRGCESVARAFEKEIQSRSVAVIAIPHGSLLELSKSDLHLFSNHYKKIAAGLQIPSGSGWDPLRSVVEEKLFPAYKQDIHFAALSLDQVGLRNYGNCSVVLKTDLIAHRASLFEDNNVVLLAKTLKLHLNDELPLGFRSTWEDRHCLCIAKLCDDLKPHTIMAEFPSLLLNQAASTDDDRFIEVHVFGPMSLRTVDQVTVIDSARRVPKAVLAEIQRMLDSSGVPVRIERR